MLSLTLTVKPCPVLGNGDDVEGQSTAVHDVSGGGAMAWCRCVPCCWPTSAEQLAAECSSEDPWHGVIAESLSMKRKSGPTPYTINPTPYTINPNS